MIMKFLASAILLLSITACTAVPQEVESYSPPESCEQSQVISAFDARLSGAEYIPTEWEPASGTDLSDIYELGGIACTYGIESAEIGGTVMWARVTDKFWLAKKDQWLTAGYRAVDVPGLDETEAFEMSTTSADDFPVWFINLKIRGVWIQFGASKFVNNLDDALDIVVASSSVLLKK